MGEDHGGCWQDYWLFPKEEDFSLKFPSDAQTMWFTMMRKRHLQTARDGDCLLHSVIASMELEPMLADAKQLAVTKNCYTNTIRALRYKLGKFIFNYKNSAKMTTLGGTLWEVIEASSFYAIDGCTSSRAHLLTPSHVSVRHGGRHLQHHEPGLLSGDSAPPTASYNGCIEPVKSLSSIRLLFKSLFVCVYLLSMYFFFSCSLTEFLQLNVSIHVYSNDPLLEPKKEGQDDHNHSIILPLWPDSEPAGDIYLLHEQDKRGTGRVR